MKFGKEETDMGNGLNTALCPPRKTGHTAAVRAFHIFSAADR